METLGITQGKLRETRCVSEDRDISSFSLCVSIIKISTFESQESVLDKRTPNRPGTSGVVFGASRVFILVEESVYSRSEDRVVMVWVDRIL